MLFAKLARILNHSDQKTVDVDSALKDRGFVWQGLDYLEQEPEDEEEPKREKVRDVPFRAASTH